MTEQEIKTIKSADKKAVPENRQMMPEVPETTAESMEFMKLSPKLAWCIITKLYYIGQSNFIITYWAF